MALQLDYEAAPAITAACYAFPEAVLSSMTHIKPSSELTVAPTVEAGPLHCAAPGAARAWSSRSPQTVAN